MKAAVMARGLGRRMRATGGDAAALTTEQEEAAAAGLKAMMPVGRGPDGGRPFLDYVLHELAEAGARDIALVSAPDHAHVRRWYDDVVRPGRIRITFVVQAEPRGTADAVLACESWAGGDDFLVVNGDNLYPAEALRSLAALGEPGLAAFDRDALVAAGNVTAARVGAFATVDVDADGYLCGVTEKPGAAATAAGAALVSMNCWRFDARIFTPCRDVEPSPRGELELPAAVMLGVRRGLTFRVVHARGEVLDLSNRGDVAAVGRRLAARTVTL